MSAQAVGGAVGRNEISIIVPCHRVVGTNGSLTGYAGGIDKKKKLLTLEKADMKQFFSFQRRGLHYETRNLEDINRSFEMQAPEFENKNS